MCEFCTFDREGLSCTQATCAATGSACACRLSGPERCPTCGHDCESWYFALGAHGAPSSINDFFGGESAENPGYDRYPATQAILVAAAKEWFEEQGVGDDGLNPADLAWLSARLPEGTYRSQGEVLATLFQPIEGSPLVGPEWIRIERLGALPIGSLLRVPSGQSAVLVDSDDTGVDVFPAGEHRVTRENAPRAAARSRPPAPGYPWGVLRASVVFLSQGELTGTLSYRGGGGSGAPLYVQADVGYALSDSRRFAESTIGHAFLTGSRPAASLLSALVEPEFERITGSTGAASADADGKRVETAIQSALQAAGWTGHRVTVRYAGSNPAAAAFSGPAGDPLAHLPPEVQAVVRARMEAAMRRGPPPAARSPAPSGMGAPAAPAAACPSCRAPNPVGVKFCQNCGKPMAVKRTCPQCGREVAASVKFCGNCGARLV